MNNLALWLLIACSIAIGWALGRWGARAPSLNRDGGLGVQLPAGVRFTFEQYSDEAIDKYVQGLEVGKETLPMHFSIASHFRKKGEVDRAILIHQNLLAHPMLDRDHRERATLELARDYLSAGLLDRSEALFKQLEKSRQWGARSLQFLLDIYQDEKEWRAAKETGLKLDYRRHPEFRKRIAHYCCEEALVAQRRGDGAEVKRLLREALHYDRTCVRVSLMLAQLHEDAGDCREAIKVLAGVEAQDPSFVPETVPALVRCYRKLGEETKLRLYLGALLQRRGTPGLVIAYAESLESTAGKRAALGFLGDKLRQHPSIKGLDYSLALQLDLASEAARQGEAEPVVGSGQAELVALRYVTRALLQDKPRYLCENCGFSGSMLLWFCPSCKQWETIKPRAGTAGE